MELSEAVHFIMSAVGALLLLAEVNEWYSSVLTAGLISCALEMFGHSLLLKCLPHFGFGWRGFIHTACKETSKVNWLTMFYSIDSGSYLMCIGDVRSFLVVKVPTVKAAMRYRIHFWLEVPIIGYCKVEKAQSFMLFEISFHSTNSFWLLGQLAIAGGPNNDVICHIISLQDSEVAWLPNWKKLLLSK